MWHKPCRTFHPWCPCIKTRCLLYNIGQLSPDTPCTWMNRILEQQARRLACICEVRWKKSTRQSDCYFVEDDIFTFIFFLENHCILIQISPNFVSNGPTNNKLSEEVAPFTNTETSIPAWISNYIHYKVWDEITYTFLNCSRWSLGMDKSFHPTISWACNYLSMLGKVKPC